jgi:dTMP kinase
MAPKGYFIVFEGLDGSGTTTQVMKLANHLYNKDDKRSYLLSREPSTLTPEGNEIRRRLSGNLLLGESPTDDFHYWADLFVTDRLFHMDHIVLPNTRNGVTCITDRYMLSTLAYQSTQGGQMESLIELHEGMPSPDLTLFIDVPADVALERIRMNRTGNPEYFEEKRGFLDRTVNNYHAAVELFRNKHNIVTIDGTKTIDEIAGRIKNEVDFLIDRKHIEN